MLKSNINIVVFFFYIFGFFRTVESASLVNCDKLIQAYIKKNKLKKNLKLPIERKCVSTEEPVFFDDIKQSEQPRVLDLYDNLKKKRKNVNQKNQKLKKKK
jgi:hypothetical protein